MLSLKPFRTKAEGLPDILNYAALIGDGVVLCKNGALLAAFSFYPGDDASATNTERNWISKQLNSHLRTFDSGWCMWIDAIRMSSPGYPDPSQSHFPDPISKMIDVERRQMFSREDTHYETEYVLVIQYLPPLQRESEVVNSFIDDDSRDGKDPSNYLMGQILDGFEKRLQDFQDGTKDLLNMRRMGSMIAGSGDDTYESDQLINYLHFTITGDALALRIPDTPMYLDSWLGYPSFWHGTVPKVDDKYIACVAIDGFPSSTSPGILSLFESLAVPFRWSSRYIFLDKNEALAALAQYHRVWETNVRSFKSQVFKTSKGIINTDALGMTQEIEQTMADVRSDLVSAGYYTTVVVLMNENRELLLEQARYVKKAIERKGFHARVETYNAAQAWNGTLPGHPHPNVRRPMIHTLSLSELLPLSGIWPGLRENPCGFYPAGSPPLMQVITSGATPLRINLHDGDVGHTLVFGPTGAGKTTFLAFILAQFRRYRSRTRPDGSTDPASITAFDKQRSLYTLCKAVGGQHYDIGSDEGGMVLCPLADLETAKDIIFAEGWIASCFELKTNKAPTPEQVNEIHRTLVQMQGAPKSQRSLTHFNATVQSKDIRMAMSHYTNKGSMGHILDGEHDSLNSSSFVVYEIDDLMALGEVNAIPVLLYLFRRFQKSLNGQPAILSLDEAWVMLAHPVFREKLKDWLKELRKQNCAVLIATQSLADAIESGLISTLLEQCPTKIFLPNKEARSEEASKYYKIFGLNDNEINLLSNAQYKKDYYLKSPMGRRLFQLGLGPLALSFVAVSDKDTLREVKAHEANYGVDWPIHWLRKNGVDYEKFVR